MRAPLRLMLTFACATTPLMALAADFVPREVRVCPAAAGVRDPEFDRSTRRMTWVDTAGNLKVSLLNDDGSIASPGCQGTLVDTGLTLRLNDFPLLNGSEWSRSQAGTELYYMKLDGQGRPAMARASRNGAWQTEWLGNGLNRGLPIPTIDAADAQPRIFYAYAPPGQAWEWRWRHVADPSLEYTFPGPARESSGGAPRWIPGQRALSTVVPDASGVPQAARFHIDSGTLEMLTNDPGAKDEVWMWTAPEFGETVFMTVVDGCCLRIYRGTAPNWTLIRTVNAASLSPRAGIFSPEPFVYKGRSYVVLQVSRQKYAAAELWIAGIDPANPLLRRISDPARPGVIRSEPEFMETPGGAFIYYTVIEGQDKASLFRADTGL